MYHVSFARLGDKTKFARVLTQLVKNPVLQKETAETIGKLYNCSTTVANFALQASQLVETQRPVTWNKDK